MKTHLILFSAAGVLFFSCTKTTTTNSIDSSGVYNQIIKTDYLGFESYGQSLSVGGQGKKPTWVASATQKYNSVMPDLGDRSLDYLHQVPGSFVPLIEKLDSDGTMGETLCSGACEMFAQVYPERPYILHAVASGIGGQTVAGLSKGSPTYKRYMSDITCAYNTAASMGKTYALGASGWTQGEADIDQTATTYDEYRSTLSELHTTLNVDVAAVTHQTNSFPFIVGQISTNNRTMASMLNPDVALAQLDLCINDPGFTLAAPMYFFDFISDNTHLTADNYRRLAAYYGYAEKKLLVDGVKNFVYVKHTVVEKNNLCLVFNVPVAPLVFDTVTVTNPGNYGFTVFNAAGDTLKLRAVQIRGGDSVVIRCASSPTGGSVTYAINGEYRTAGRIHGPRGCLRDSQGNSVIFDPGDSTHTNFPLHNWCPIFKVQL